LFDSLKYAKILESSGVTRKQAEAHIQILSRVMGEEVATKQDLALLNEKMDNLKWSLESKMDRGFRHVDDKIEKLQYKLQYDLVMKLGALITVLFGAALGIAGLFFA
jgi:hypothetical protein